MRYKIWINIERNTLNLHRLEQKMEELGYALCMQYVQDHDEQAIIRLAAEADAVICGLERWNERTLRAVCKRMRFLLRFGTGYDNIDIPCATAHGVLVANIPGANAAAVAELALLHILNLGRGMTQDVYLPARGWTVGGMGTELEGKTIGLIGFGNVAKKLREFLRGFSVKILVYDPYIKLDPSQYDVEVASDYREIFSRSDYISLHVPCTAETADLVCEQTLRMMKKTAYLVNTARGGLIREKDLLRATAEDWIAGAGLDVLRVEPGDPASPLIGARNIVLTPHLGGRSVESVLRSEDMLIQAISDYFAGKMPFHTLNPELLQNDAAHRT